MKFTWVAQLSIALQYSCFVNFAFLIVTWFVVDITNLYNPLLISGCIFYFMNIFYIFIIALFFLAEQIKTFQNTRLKCVLVSVCHLFKLFLVLPHFIFSLMGNLLSPITILIFYTFFYTDMFLMIVFAYAAFTVSRVCDIWDFDKIFLHPFCPKVLIFSFIVFNNLVATIPFFIFQM